MTLGSIRRKGWLLYSNLVRWKWIHIYGHIIGKDVVISPHASLDKGVNGIHIGEGTHVLGGASILNHEFARKIKNKTYIGNHCIIGARCMILPGLHIGNEVVIGAGTIVTKSIPDNCVVVGNPGRIVKTGVKVRNGKIIEPGKRVKE